MKRLDLTTLLGLAIGLACIGGGAALEGIGPGFLWQPTAALIVFGGTISAIAVRRGLAGLLSTVRAALGLFSKPGVDEFDAEVARLAWLARAARREGVKAYENYAEGSRDPLVICALALAAEYATPEATRAALERVLDDEEEGGLREAETLEAAGAYMPTFGILGAVLGLINVLRSIDAPDALGAGIATAFVATVYGVGVANLFMFPLASRLRERHRAHMKRREALTESLVALVAQETPSAIASRGGARPAVAVRRADSAQRLSGVAR